MGGSVREGETPVPLTSKGEPACPILKVSSHMYKLTTTNTLTTKKNIEKKETQNDLSTDDIESKVLTVSKGLKNNLMKSLGKGNNGAYKCILRSNASITLNSSGAFLSYFPMDPSASAEWNSFTTLFDEFRILKGTLQIEPLYQGSITAGVTAVCFDNDSANAPSNIAEVLDYQNSVLKTSSKSLHYEFRRPDVTNSAYWVDVATPTSQIGAVRILIGYGPVSTTAYYYNMTYHVEFRGRR
jgi:hypothetical protein